jgi:glucose/mannose transport system substrate-binding protein
MRFVPTTARDRGKTGVPGRILLLTTVAKQVMLGDLQHQPSMHRTTKCLILTLAAVSCCTNLYVSPARAADKSQLEVFSYWTSGSEAAALDALFKVFKQSNPDVEIINAVVAGGSGSAALPVLQTRLAGGKPPDTWQSHPGWELFARYVVPGFCQDVTDVYKSENWASVVPKSLLDQLTLKGKIYAVMTGVHRLNVLWYNKKILDQQGIKIGDKLSFADFFAAAEKLKAAGVTPLAVGDSGIWASGDILENALLAKVGPQVWPDLFTGKLSWSSPNVKDALAVYGKFLEYQNNDHTALSWDQAIKAVIDGRCAFSVMGDWSFGEFLKANQKENQDFGWVAFPETDSDFLVVGDSFVAAKNAPHPGQAIAWLKAIGSKEAQLNFNKIKGSIPVRIDIDPKELSVYQQWSMSDFKKDALVPSIFHGAAAPPALEQAISDAVSAFVVSKNAEAFAKSVDAAVKDSASE